MPALATTGGRQHLVVLHAAPPSAGNWQQQLLPGQDSGLSPGQKIGMWVLLSVSCAALAGPMVHMTADQR